MNIVLAFVLLYVFFAAIGPQDTTRVVDQVDKNFPAQGVLQPGDRLVAVDGHRGGPGSAVEPRELARLRRAARTLEDGCRAVEPAKLTIVRNGERLTVTIRPKYDFPAAPDGADAGRLRLQARAARAGCRSARPSRRPPTATGSSRSRRCGCRRGSINPEERKQISGVVGSYEVTRQTILKQVENVIGILAIISLSLAIVNLFPFLPAGRRPHLLGDRGEGPRPPRPCA